MKIEGYQKWKVQWLDLWGSFCEQKCNDKSRLRRAWIKSFKLKISNNRLKTKYHSTCPILRLSGLRPNLWYALRLAPNLTEFWLQISCLMSSMDLSICYYWVYSWRIWKWISHMITTCYKLCYKFVRIIRDIIMWV